MRKLVMAGTVLAIMGTVVPAQAAVGPTAPLGEIRYGIESTVTSTTSHILASGMRQFCFTRQTAIAAREYPLNYVLFRFNERFQVCYHMVSLYDAVIDGWSDGTWPSSVGYGWEFEGVVSGWHSGGKGYRYVKEYRRAKFCFVNPYVGDCSYPYLWQGLWANYDHTGPQWHRGGGF